MSEGLNELPVGMQVGATLIATIIGGGVAFYSFSKKWLDKAGHKDKSRDDQSSSESKPSRELVSSLRSIEDELRRHTDSIYRLADSVRDLLDHIRDRDRD